MAAFRDRQGAGSSGSGSAAAAGAADGGAKKASSLRSVPGVGPKNEQLLLAHGHSSLDALQQHFSRDVRGDTAAMAKYLRNDVGIRLKQHCDMIAGHLLELARAEAEAAAPLPAPGKKLTLCVEGNISAGKSTFLKMLSSQLVELQEVVEMVPEPVDQWQNVGGQGGNMLEQFYTDPQRYAYTFQNYVFITRVMQEQASAASSSANSASQRLIERSVFSDRMVFVRAVHNAQWMSELELQVYDSWFNPIVTALPTVIPDGFIYLRANPDTCLTRMHRRSRNEEGGVSLDYLQQLHQMHEEWLRRPESVYAIKQQLLKHERDAPRPLSGSFSLESELAQLMQVRQHFGTVADELKLRSLSLELFDAGVEALKEPDGLENQIFFLDRKHQQFMHPLADRIPVLVLDYDQDIDLERDEVAKQAYAQQVSKYFKWVKQLQRNRSAWCGRVALEAGVRRLGAQQGSAAGDALMRQLAQQASALQRGELAVA